MNISPNKSLIREIAPGQIQIGNNPFQPVVEINDNEGLVSAFGDGLLTASSLINISGDSINYIDGTFENRPTAEGKNVLIEGDLEPRIELIENQISGSIGVTYEEAQAIAKKWAIILG
jgi:hypothetical protein